MLLAAEGKKQEALITNPFPNYFDNDLFLYSLLNMKEEVLKIVSEEGKTWVSSYPRLKNIRFLDFIREEPAFIEVLAKAKKVHEERVVKYGHLFDED